ncbi:glycosyltransferase family 2 protein [Aquipuribacter sp. SD81]|uniref:glycosyltransferase family 2 protein n=1 Tax=Aquipuribacter sp. SD81 TaxID=3127703 RepID=UPI003016B1C2
MTQHADPAPQADPEASGGHDPHVTVVIATRDRRELLGVALRAVAAQDWVGTLDVVLVYDQVPVDAEPPAPPGLEVLAVPNSRTPGLAGARNTGVLAARGQLVAFCDDDDAWQPDKLRRQVARLRAEPGAGAVVTGIRVRYGDTVVERVPAVDRLGADLTTSRMTGAHPSSYLVRRDLLTGEVGLVDEDLPGGYGEDYDLLLRLVRVAPVLVEQAPLVDVLWHRGSFFSRRWLSMAEGLAYLVAKHPDLSRDARGSAWLAGQRAFALAAAGRRREAAGLALRAWRRDPRQMRAPLALAVAAGVLSPERVVHELNRRGRGI